MSHVTLIMALSSWFRYIFDKSSFSEKLYSAAELLCVLT